MSLQKAISRRHATLAAGVFAASMVLLVALGIMTYHNYRREVVLEKDFYTQKGEAILQALQAGIQVGIREAGWDKESVRRLLEKTASAPGIRQLSVVGAYGVVVSGAPSDGSPVPAFTRPGADTTATDVLATPRGDHLIRVTRRLETSLQDCVHPGCWRRVLGVSASRPLWLTVVLDMAEFDAAIREDIRRAMFASALLLLLAGSSVLSLVILRRTVQTNEELEKTETFVRNLVESLPDGLISLDHEGRVETVNRSAVRLLGVSPDEVSGRPIEDVLPGCEVGKSLSAKPGNVFEYQVACKTRTGRTIPLSLTVNRILSQDGTVLGTLVNLKSLEDVKRLERKLRMSEQMAALGRMAAGIAHEVRNPLSSIKGFSQYFQKKFDPDGEDWTYAAIMVKEVDRLNRVIEDLLNLARPQRIRIEDVAVADVVTHVLRLVEADLSGRGLEVRVERLEGLTVRADADMLTQVLLNLAINAIEAMESGGRLTFEGEATGDLVTLRVRDTGPGIPREQLPHIFDPFFTSKSGGTGLGLAIVYRIVENLQGTIDVASNDREGTTFTLTFPAGGGRDTT